MYYNAWNALPAFLQSSTSDWLRGDFWWGDVDPFVVIFAFFALIGIVCLFFRLIDGVRR